jgi:hypothetical protein
MDDEFFYKISGNAQTDLCDDLVFLFCFWRTLPLHVVQKYFSIIKMFVMIYKYLFLVIASAAVVVLFFGFIRTTLNSKEVIKLLKDKNQG